MSGAGKSTLLQVLAGLLAADRGECVVTGRVGYVPQVDALHPELPVRAELRFAARLRCPGLDGAAIERRIGEVLAELGIAALRDRVIATLSAGERKRVSVAIELLGDPDLLLLDEATAGIDPRHEVGLLRHLRRLADSGCAVVLATHSTLALGEFDRLLLLGRAGRQLYFGPPEQALRLAGAGTYVELFERDDVIAGTAVAVTDGAPGTDAARVPGRSAPGGRTLGGRALGPLVRREFVRLVRERRRLLLLALQAPLLGLLVRAMAGPDGLGLGALSLNLTARRVVLTLVLSALWLGATNAVLEIVKDRAVISRERVAGIRPAGRLVAKALVLAAVGGVQAVVLVAVGVAGSPPPVAPAAGGPWWLVLVVTLWACGFATACVALALSAWANRGEVALAVLPLVLVPQLVLSGGVMAMQDAPALRAVSYVATARWGMSAVASAVDLRGIETSTVVPIPLDHQALSVVRHQDADRYWNADAATWWTDLGVLAALAAAFLVLAAWGVRRRD
ncbi:MAG: ATP-binding cassette domain-containing protein [Jatrophihabitans sp.]|nr:MAG: ATP-binding cassette domain-containing protein [Jatrophihabitans sp.]